MGTMTQQPLTDLPAGRHGGTSTCDGRSPSAALSAPSAGSALKMGLRGRRGMTLLEVLLTLAIFLVGSVGIIGLFTAASVLHKDAVDRRTAAYIAETVLAHVQAQAMHEVFAKTTISNGGYASDRQPGRSRRCG